MSMSIKKRIWSLPATAAVIFSLGLALSVYFSTIAISSIHTTETVDYPILDQSKSLITDVGGLVKALQEAVSEGDKKRLEAIELNAKSIRDSMKNLGQINGQLETSERLTKEFEAYYSPALSVAKIMMEIEQGDPMPMIGKMQSTLNALQTDLAKTQESAKKQFKSGVEKSGDSVNNVLYTTIFVAVMIVLTLGGVSFIVVRGIWQQLGGEPEYTREIAVAVAAGDLSMDIHTDPNDKTSLLVALKEMKTKLELMVSEIKLSAETIKVASSEISSGNNDLSSRTESQANSLQETSSSMASLSDTVKQNADNAKQANRLADIASDVAVKGGEVVNQVIGTMSQINGSSKKIVDIITVIDGIAFQTNILALNAAVEAARAGEQGRGFAVVASEVRNLAQRSAAAAKEIKTLISDSVDKVTQGSQLVDHAGQTMGEIVDSVKRVSDIMKEISAASQDQSAGIQEIGRAIEHMDEMTQQNSAMVEEAASAASSMNTEAERLTQSLDVFKLSNSGMTGARDSHQPNQLLKISNASY
ncbi:methyl-accepting chemotaxis protein [Oxalobacteraceae bacterium GrIS 1.18]